MGFLVKVQPIPDYVTYTDPEYAALCRKAKDRKVTADMDMLLRVIREGKPMSRNQVFDRSPLGHRATYDAMKELTAGTFIHVDQNKRLRLVPDIDMTVAEARREVVRRLFRNYGIFTAENLQRYMRYEMPMKDLRTVLSELEDEGFLVKGFLMDGDDSVHWLLADDVGRIGTTAVKEQFVLSPEDNLHNYLQPWIKQMLGSSYHSLIMNGPRVIGSFRGKIKAKDMELQELNGGAEARAVLSAHLRSMGLTLRMPEPSDAVPDWEVQAFYEKTHPGEV